MIIGGGRAEIVKQSVTLHQKNVWHGLFLFLYMILLKCCNVMVCVFTKACLAWRRGAWWLIADIWAWLWPFMGHECTLSHRAGCCYSFPLGKGAMQLLGNTSPEFYYVETPNLVCRQLLHWKKAAQAIKSCGSFLQRNGAVPGIPDCGHEHKEWRKAL